jgi:hypothetical protein
MRYQQHAPLFVPLPQPGVCKLTELYRAHVSPWTTPRNLPVSAQEELTLQLWRQKTGGFGASHPRSNSGHLQLRDPLPELLLHLLSYKLVCYQWQMVDIGPPIH